MTNKVVVTGMGVLCSAGATVSQLWDKIVQKKVLTQYDYRLENAPVKCSCPLSNWNPKLRFKQAAFTQVDPFIQYAVYAAQEALDDANIQPGYNLPSNKIGIVVGNSLAGISTLEKIINKESEVGPASVSASYILSTMTNMASANISVHLGITGPSYFLSTACASGADAIGRGKRMIESGECDTVIVGGSEAPITKNVVTAFAKLGALSRNNIGEGSIRPFDKERNGFVISEGAGFLVLEHESQAQKRKANIHARLLGYGSSSDAYHMTTPTPSGKGLTQAVEKALSDANIESIEIGYINAHGTATSLNDRLENTVYGDIFGLTTPVTSTKGVTGHPLAASGAIEAIASIQSLKTNTIPGTAGLNIIDDDIKINVNRETTKPLNSLLVMSSSIGFGGQNSVLIFEK
ncbi:beta-ketoacyl-[acyl-carrier-protein] synthase family protein [Kushneria aurantia]|uniref:Beta-ketoacyl-[acyl-carrier-protein] synthase family protein n=1 Tax=Kushneria aurantia TaxID=504092 RepID=A0ABV6G491_9GAMM|nr:beta-ketoacyl-[acyl-carrier-protein] synthase family protein [Kushneria aurantia]